MHIKIKRGLDIPIEGVPSGDVQSLPPPKSVALDLDPFGDVKFKLHVRVGDAVKIGQPLAHDKSHPDRLFVSPAGGTIKEIRRGLKRRLLAIIIELADREEEAPTPDPTDLRAFLLATGCFAHIRMRPFGLLADPTQTPRAIFVKAIESAPFVPSAEMQIAGHEAHFQAGLNALAKLTDGPVHVITRQGFPFPLQNVEHHTASGPHPVANASVHIHKIAPIKGAEDVVWTLDAHGVITIGKLLTTGQHHTTKVIGIGGNGILPDRRHFVRVRFGHPIDALLANRSERGKLRLISGNPLVGTKVEIEDYLGFCHYAFTAIPEPTKRQFIHFLRPGFGRYSATRAYPAGHFHTDKRYPFTTSLHGEERAFIDGRIYDRVMPMQIPTMPLVKAVIGRDWETAEFLGLLEVDPEDFALPTFICPSKVEMCELIHEGLREYAAEIL